MGAPCLIPADFVVGRQGRDIVIFRQQWLDDDPFDPRWELRRLVELTRQLGYPEQGHLASGIAFERTDDEAPYDCLCLCDGLRLRAVYQRDLFVQDLVEQ